MSSNQQSSSPRTVLVGEKDHQMSGLFRSNLRIVVGSYAVQEVSTKI